MRSSLLTIPLSLCVLAVACQEPSTNRVPTPPSVQILQPDPAEEAQEFSAGVTIEFIASVNDGFDAAEDLVVTWSSHYSDGEGPQTLDLGETAVDAGGMATLQTNSLPSATHSVTVQVIDTDGLTDSDSVDVIVLAGDAPPSVVIEEPQEGDIFGEEGVITFVATAFDDAGAETLTASWASNLDGVFDTGPPPATGVMVVTTDELSVGDHAIAVTVTDVYGQDASASVTIHIEAANVAPSAPLVEILPAAPSTDDDLLCVGSDAVDPNGDTVTYSYSWLRDGAPTGNTTDTVPSVDTSLGDEWTCQAVASDGELEGPLGEASVLVLPLEGDLVITEVMLAPYAVDDSVGEWFELYNASGADIDLEGWTLSDVVAGDSDTISGSLIVPAGGTVVLGNNWDPATNGNVPVDYWYSGFTLGDVSDEIVISYYAAEVDRIEYDLSGAWPALVPGQAMMLAVDFSDAVSNDDPLNWCGSTTSLGVGYDFGTPGAANDDCACYDSDHDVDGFGVDPSCAQFDCNDADATVYPGAAEICEDGIDQDCDGADSYCDCADTDLDGDGYGTGALCGLVDCDDGDPAIYPGAVEVCNGVDDDCDGVADDGIDLDGDGFTGCGGIDCDDASASIYPGAVEQCNGADDDCNGAVDDTVDGDGDGYYGCGGSDCDDTDAGVNPGAADLCDGVDVDCDGVDGNDHGGDGYETNDSRGTAVHLYTNNNNASMSDAVSDATIHTTSDQDYFYIYQADPFAGTFSVQGSVTPPPGISVYLELYEEGTKIAGGPGHQSVLDEGHWLYDDSANYYFRVVWESGTPDPCDTYTLSVSSSG